MHENLAHHHHHQHVFHFLYRILLAAPTGAGKSNLVLRIIRERARVLSHPLTAILYCYGHAANTPEDEQFQADLRAAYPDIKFHVGLPQFSEILFIPGHKLCVLDDMASEIVSDKAVFDAVTQASRRSKLSMFFLTQNLFHAGQYAKDLSRNCTAKIIWDDLADRQYISFLNRQIEPDSPRFLSRIMMWLRHNVKNYYDQYVILDASRHSKLPVEMRVRTNIFPMASQDGAIRPIFFKPSKPPKY